MAEPNAIELYRALLRNAHEFLEGTMADVTPTQFDWDPPGTAFSIAANYAHVLASTDMGIHQLLLGKAPLASTEWASAFGPGGPPPGGPGVDLKAWSRKATVEPAALRRYGRAVYAAADQFLASLAPKDLEQALDLSALGLGQQTWQFVLTAILANTSLHTGEISCLKGLQGAKGYPV